MSTMESTGLTDAALEPKDQAPVRPPRFGIQSRLIYWGILVLMASLLLWLGVELAKRIEWFLPYAGGLGLSLIAGGYFLELRKARNSRRSHQKPFKQSSGTSDQ